MDSVWLTAWGQKQSRLAERLTDVRRVQTGECDRGQPERSPSTWLFLSLTLKKKQNSPPPPPTTTAHWLSCIHATIRVVQAEMLERALSLWMYVTLACPVTLSRSDVFQQAQSGLQSSSSDQAQRPICRLKQLCLLLSNSFYVQNCTEVDVKVLMRQKKSLVVSFIPSFFSIELIGLPKRDFLRTKRAANFQGAPILF